MKSILLTLVLISSSFTAFAQETKSEKVAAQITAALQSNELQVILKSEDGAGVLQKVEYFQPSRMNPAQSRIEITFLSRSGPSLQECPVNVFVNTSSYKIEGIRQMPCRDSQ